MENEPNFPPDKTQRTPGMSCQAVKHAVANLYRHDDFTLEKIGCGFFSDVYKVQHKVTKEIMCLKMNTLESNKPNVLKEVQLLNKLHHRNILKLKGVCVHDGLLHALTEYMNGGSLELLLADKCVELTWEVRMRMGADIAKGLSYLHAKGVFHRDLTSKNILIRESEIGKYRYTAVVGDLGLAARIPANVTIALPVVGSPYWMAPECFNGNKYDEKVDVFAYGIILCEMIARIEADPDILPRTENFGLDYVEFSKMVEDCPLMFLNLAFSCCQFEPKKRPSFHDITKKLEEISSRSQMAVVLTDISKLGLQSTESISKSILDQILTDKIRRQSFSSIGVSQSGNLTSLDSLVVGKVMSKDDEFYKPGHMNPFAGRFEEKMVPPALDEGPNVLKMSVLASSSEAPSSCFTTTDLPLHQRTVKRSLSCPSSPTTLQHRMELAEFQQLAKKFEAEMAVEDDNESESSSSNDSGMGFRLSQRKLSLQATFHTRHRPDSIHSHMTRKTFERYFLEVDDYPIRSHSSSESCLSMDDSCVLSPTSSLSSYGEQCDDLCQKSSDFLSRDKFKELVHRWEAKQGGTISLGHGSHQSSLSVFTDDRLEQKFRELRKKWEMETKLSNKK